MELDQLRSTEDDENGEEQAGNDGMDELMRHRNAHKLIADNCHS